MVNEPIEIELSKKVAIENIAILCSKYLIAVMKACDLKTHIHCDIVDPESGQRYELKFHTKEFAQPDTQHTWPTDEQMKELGKIPYRNPDDFPEPHMNQ